MEKKLVYRVRRELEERIECPNCRERGYNSRLPICALDGKASIWCKHCKAVVHIERIEKK